MQKIDTKTKSQQLRAWANTQRKTPTKARTSCRSHCSTSWASWKFASFRSFSSACGTVSAVVPQKLSFIVVTRKNDLTKIMDQLFLKKKCYCRLRTCFFSTTSTAIELSQETLCNNSTKRLMRAAPHWPHQRWRSTPTWTTGSCLSLKDTVFSVTVLCVIFVQHLFDYTITIHHWFRTGIDHGHVLTPQFAFLSLLSTYAVLCGKPKSPFCSLLVLGPSAKNSWAWTQHRQHSVTFQNMPKLD